MSNQINREETIEAITKLAGIDPVHLTGKTDEELALMLEEAESDTEIKKDESEEGKPSEEGNKSTEDLSLLSNKELQAKLAKLGVDEKDYKRLNKENLIKLIQEGKPSEEGNKSTEENPDQVVDTGEDVVVNRNVMHDGVLYKKDLVLDKNSPVRRLFLSKGYADLI